ncbi:DUF128 domain-containing protein [Candidatus Hydrogenedentota bacterium]
MEPRTKRRMASILRVLREAGEPAGGQFISEKLRLSGIDMNERTVRNYLAETDARGWTVNLRRRGRSLTEAGISELDSALIIDKVGFVSARADALAYEMTFDPYTGMGKVILNISTVAAEHARSAVTEILKVYKAELGMGRKLAVATAGHWIGDYQVPEGRFALGTICSMSLNGAFLQANIATTSRFGGLLQLEQGKPERFTQIINYDGSSLDPLEIFIQGRMTSVAQAAATGFGVVGASFREIPVVAVAEAEKLSDKLKEIGLGGIFAMGRPNQPLLDIPVQPGRAGLIVCGGLNTLAAVEERGISTENSAMGALCPFDDLVDYTVLYQLARGRDI